MTEAELLELFTLARAQLDAAFAQVIALNFAMIVAIFYFLHRSGLLLKIAVFILYAIGWYIFVTSAGLAGRQMQGLISELYALQEAGSAGVTTVLIVETMNSPENMMYLIAANAANFLLLIGAFIFLFFWKPPADGKT